MTPDVQHEWPDGWGFVTTVDRREFLKLTASGLLVVFTAEAWLHGQEPARVPSGRPQGYPSDLNAYVHIGENGRVTCLVGKIEMGQGAMNSLPQLVAEELDVPLSMVDIVMGDTDLCPWDMGTFGSLSIRQFGPILRQAAAEARTMLVEQAAERFGVPAEQVEVRDGVLVDRQDPTGHRTSYGALAAGRRLERPVRRPVVLESRTRHTVVGTNAPRRDAVAKVTGTAKYAGDIVPPGALHARILRPPAHGSQLLTVDTTAAARVPGVRVVQDGDLVAVLHAHWDEADKALALVKATWSPSTNTLTDRTIFSHLETAAPAPQTIAQGGVLGDGERLASTVVEHTYLNSYVAHAPMEPHTAVASVENGRVTVWASTQTPFPLKSQVAGALKWPADKVRIMTPYVGGGFGGKSAGRQAVEAARLTVAAGVPVRVAWSRAEEFFYDTFRPAAVIRVRAGADTAGRIVFWDNTIIGAGERGSEHLYDIPHHRTVARGGWNANTPGLHPFAIGAWRAPAANSNAFAREGHIDALASALKRDPVAFRLANLTDARMARVLTAAAERFGWTAKAGPSGRGMGVALGSDAGTYVAAIAEVRVDRTTGAIRVVRLVCAQDMGLVVNPDGARQQMEGCIMMGLGYTLSEEVAFANGVIRSTNFDTYELPRFEWQPVFEPVILDSPDMPAQGGGEPAIVTMGAVVANAVFDAIGVRVFQLPLTAERVKAALASKAGRG